MQGSFFTEQNLSEFAVKNVFQAKQKGRRRRSVVWNIHHVFKQPFDGFNGHQRMLFLCERESSCQPFIFIQKYKSFFCFQNAIESLATNFLGPK